MANCTNVGYPGTNVPLPQLTPATTLNCFISGYTQAAATITVSVFQNGNPTALATIKGTGTQQTPMGSASFKIQPGNTYYATVSSTMGQTSRVLTNYSVLSNSTTSYVGSYIMCAEDTPNGGDCDFNDCVVTITWTLFAG
jgi:hypothetical protein